MAKYKIGEFCRMLGVTEDTVRYYEKCGLIQAEKNEQNGYRYFSDYDARTIIWCRICRGTGVSVEELTCLMKKGTSDGFGDFLSIRKRILEQEIQEKLTLLRQIEELQTAADKAMKHQQECHLDELKEMYILPLSSQDHFAAHKGEEEQIRNWNHAMPYTFITLKIEKEVLLGKKNWFYQWGLGIDSENVQYLQQANWLSAEKRTEEKCVVGYLEILEGRELQKGDLTFLLEDIRAENYEIRADAVGKVLNRRKKNGELCYDLVIYIPIY